MTERHSIYDIYVNWLVQYDVKNEVSVLHDMLSLVSGIRSWCHVYAMTNNEVFMLHMLSLPLENLGVFW